MAHANKGIQWDDSGFKIKFLDGSPVDDEYKAKVYAFVEEIAAFEESLSPDELDELDREILRKKGV